MRLRPSSRLRKGPEFERVFREGTAIGGPLFVVRRVENGLDHPRWGFAVGKKIAPLAVTRNRVKRQLKAATQELEPSGGFDVVVVARPSALGMRYAGLRSELARSLRRAGFVVKP